MTYPDNLKYTKEHEWVSVEGDTGTVGITFHAQKELGDIVYVDLPKVGAAVEAGKSFGSVESVKAVSDIYSPVTGEVCEVNSAVVDDPGLVNREPFAGGWFFKIKLASPAELDALLSPAQYAAQIGAT